MMKTRGCSICHGSSSVIRDLMRPHCARLLLHATILLLLLVACATAVLESTMLVLLVCLLVLVLWSVCVVRLLLLLSMIHEVRLLLLLCDGAAYRVGRRHSSHCCGLLLLRMSVS